MYFERDQNPFSKKINIAFATFTFVCYLLILKEIYLKSLAFVMIKYLF